MSHPWAWDVVRTYLGLHMALARKYIFREANRISNYIITHLDHIIEGCSIQKWNVTAKVFGVYQQGVMFMYSDVWFPSKAPKSISNYPFFLYFKRMHDHCLTLPPFFPLFFFSFGMGNPPIPLAPPFFVKSICH